MGAIRDILSTMNASLKKATNPPDPAKTSEAGHKKRANDERVSDKRMSNEEALHHWLHTPFYELARLADERKKQLFPRNEVSYTLFRIINYTDICEVECNFCSFAHLPGQHQGYVLSLEEILEKTDSAYERDFRQIFFQGGVNPNIPFDYYLGSLRAIKERYPDVHIRAFSPIEILRISQFNGRSPRDILTDLMQAGLDSFPGAGAEILSTRMRDILSPKKTTPEEWYNIMKMALQLGLKASTNIVWGSQESAEEIIGHLSFIRQLQDETGNVLSFVPWTFQQQTNRFKTRLVAAHEYLKMVSLARLYLDNIDHIEVSLLVKGKEVGELALHCGADDINSPVFEENVLRSYGLKTEQECIDFIQNAGFTPVRRSFNFDYHKKS